MRPPELLWERRGIFSSLGAISASASKFARRSKGRDTGEGATRAVQSLTSKFPTGNQPYFMHQLFRTGEGRGLIANRSVTKLARSRAGIRPELDSLDQRPFAFRSLAGCNPRYFRDGWRDALLALFKRCRRQSTQPLADAMPQSRYTHRHRAVSRDPGLRCFAVEEFGRVDHIVMVEAKIIENRNV